MTYVLALNLAVSFVSFVFSMKFAAENHGPLTFSCLLLSFAFGISTYIVKNEG